MPPKHDRSVSAEAKPATGPVKAKKPRIEKPALLPTRRMSRERTTLIRDDTIKTIAEANAAASDKPATTKKDAASDKTKSKKAPKQTSNASSSKSNDERSGKDIHGSNNPDDGNGDEDEVQVTGTKQRKRATIVEDNSDDSDDIQFVEPEPEETAEEHLLRTSQKWTSPIYKFFHDPVPKEVGGRPVHEFKCIKKGCNQYVRRYLDNKDKNSTSNLRTHAIRCFGTEHVRQANKELTGSGGPQEVDGTITSSFLRVSKTTVTYSAKPYTRAETRVEAVRWVCESLRAFEIIADAGFLRLMKTGRPHMWIPSPSTLARDVHELFTRTQSRLARRIQATDTAIHIILDTWTATNHYPYVAWHIQFADKGEIINFLIEFLELPKSHTGKYISKVTIRILKEWNILKRFLGFASDGASNMGKTVDELYVGVSNFGGHASRIICFLHVIALVGKSILSQFDTRIKKSHDAELEALADGMEEEDAEIEAALLEEADKDDDEHLSGESSDEEEDDDEGADNAEEEDIVEETEEPERSEQDDDLEEWMDELEQMPPAERAEFEAATKPLKFLLVKIRKVAYAIVNSTNKVSRAWKKACRKWGKKHKKLKRDVVTRWNSTEGMLDSAIEYRAPYDEITGDRDLRKYELSEDEWKLAEQLRDVLKVFKHATLFFSRADTSANVAMVLPVFDRLHKLLTEDATDDKYAVPIRHALGLGRRTLSRYFAKADISDIYKLSMVLHPRHKLAYFRQNGYRDEWIKEVKKLLREELDEKYPARPEKSSGASASSAKASSGKDANMFDGMFVPPLPELSALFDEVTEYLKAPLEDVGVDLIRWWESKRTVYPRMARMALDYLSAPATSVSVERTFSRARVCLNYTRNRMSPATTRAVMCLGIWSQMGFITEEDQAAVSNLEAVADGPIVNKGKGTKAG